jgi:hypothetical protein
MAGATMTAQSTDLLTVAMLSKLLPVTYRRRAELVAARRSKR